MGQTGPTPGYFVKSPSGKRIGLSDSLFLRSVWTRSGAVLNGVVEWKNLEPELSLGTLVIERADSTGTALTLLRIDPAHFSFKILGEPGPGRTIRDWIVSDGCVAGINGGYFFLKNDDPQRKCPLGLLVKDGAVISGYRKNYSGCFTFDAGHPEFAYKTKPAKSVSGALQSFPMLIYDGRIPGEVMSENSALHIHRLSRRSALGEDWEGRILFLITGSEVSFRELGFLAGAMGFRHCLSLDGGGSSQLCVLSKDTVEVRGMDKIPVGIGIARK